MMVSAVSGTVKVAYLARQGVRRECHCVMRLSPGLCVLLGGSSSWSVGHRWQCWDTWDTGHVRAPPHLPPILGLGSADLPL